MEQRVCYSGATISSLSLVVCTNQQNNDKVICRNIRFNLSAQLLVFIFSHQTNCYIFLLPSHGVVFYSWIVVWVLSS